MHSRTDAHGRSIAVAAALAALIVGAGQNPATASAYVSATQGSADGYYLSVSLFGGPPNTRGPAPTVTLAADASNSPQTATASSGSAVVGPATFFTSGQLDVRTEGTLGPSGSVTSSTSIANLTGDEGEPFTAADVTSTCTVASALSGFTAITNGMLQTDSGDDRNGDGDTTDPGEHAPVTVPVPANPGPNTSYSGHIHVNGAQDNFEYNFNTQVLNPDGSLTVNAAHERFLGPTVVGDLFVGEAQCGLTGASNGTGTTGTTGTTGPAGPTGPAGQNGTNGANGSKGDRGEKGDTVAGPPGPAGPGGVGPAGPSGAAGPPGPRGLSGTLNVAVTRFRAPPRRSRRRAGDARPSASAPPRCRRPTCP